MDEVTIDKFWLERLSNHAVPEHILKYQLETLAELKATQPSLYAAQENCVLRRDEAELFAKKLSEKTSFEGYLQKNYFWGRILYYGRKFLKWDVYIPGMPSLVKRPKNRFTPDSFDLEGINEIAKLLIKDLSCPAPNTAKLRYGQILLSAMLFGGLLNKTWQRPIISGLPNMYTSSNNSLIVPFYLPETDKARLWFSDPITQGLILRWKRNHQEDHSLFERVGSSDPLIQLYVKYLRPSSIFSVSELRDQAKQRTALRTMPFLVDYAKGEIKTEPLPKTVWQRLMTGMAIDVCQKSKTEFGPELTVVKAEESKNHFGSISECRNDNQLDLYKKLQSKLSKPKYRETKISHAEYREELIAFHDQHKDYLHPCLVYIINWGIDLVSTITKENLIYYPGRDKLQLRPNSAQKYLGAIARYLITAAGTEDLKEMCSEELHDLYAETIALCPQESINRKTKKKDEKGGIARGCAEALSRFHGYMQFRNKLPAVDFSDFLPTQKKPINVDANLISYEEYDRIQKVLAPDYDQSNRLQKMQSLVTMLGFKGLRRGACLRLRICDLHPGDFPELLIRNNRYGRTKSLSSVRKLPLYALLTEIELQRLLDWHQQRILEVGNSSSESLMFCQADNNLMMKDSTLLAPIRMAMHQVTGDTSLRFHHLRHSFATWTLIRLLQADLPPFTEPFLQNPVFSAPACLKLKKLLLMNRAEGRQALYELARLLGHDSPETTLLHYVHVLDWVLARSLSTYENEPPISVEAISNLTGLSIDQVYYEKRKTKNSSDNTDWFISNYFKKIEPIKMSDEVPMKNPDIMPLEPSKNYSIDEFIRLGIHIPKILQALQIGEPISSLAQSISQTEGTLKRWIEIAMWTQALRTPRGVPRHITVKSVKNGVTTFPIPVKTVAEKELQLRILKHFAKMPEEERIERKLFVKYFIKNYSISAKGIKFDDEILAQLYIDRLSQIGIWKREICVCSYMNDSSPMTLHQERERLRKNYKKGIIVHAEYKPRKKPNLNSFSAVIKVVDPDDNRTKKMKKEKKSVYYANNAFRSTIYILAIALLEKDDLKT